MRNAAAILEEAHQLGANLDDGLPAAQALVATACSVDTGKLVRLDAVS
jgi:hypothetical protein